MMKTEATTTRYSMAGVFLIFGTILLLFPPLTHRVVGVALIVIGTLKMVQNDLIERHLVFGGGSETESGTSEDVRDS